MDLKVPTSSRNALFRTVFGLSVAALTACGGDDGGDSMMVEPPPPPPTTTLLFGVEDPCAAASAPEPSSLFYDADGRSELGDCALPTDPIDAVVESVERELHPALNTSVTLYVDGTLDTDSLTSTTTLDLSGTQATMSGLPPLVWLEQVGTSSAPSYRTVDFTVSYSDPAITLTPSRTLIAGRNYFVIATKGLMDEEVPSQSLVPSAEMGLILGLDGASTPIAAGDIEGLTADGAARLERSRLATAAVIGRLATANPPIEVDDIVSVHTFTTRLGTELLADVTARYDAAIAAGTYDYAVTMTGDVPTNDPSLPLDDYSEVSQFRRGTITVPKMLGDDDRLRANWDTVKETVEVPFMISVARQPDASIPVAVLLAGFGRSTLDATALGTAMGGTPRGSVLAVDMRCHGSRSPGADGVCRDNRSAAEVAALVDTVPNNSNPNFSGADGIPDASGVGYFPGDPRTLRDTQIAAFVEIMHIVAGLRDGRQWAAVNVNVETQTGQTHLIAPEYFALPAAAVGAYASRRPRTIQFPGGGASLRELIVNAPERQKAAFAASLPGGLTADQGATLLQRLGDFLAPVELATFQADTITNYTAGATRRGLLLAYPNISTVTPVSARTALRMGLGLQSPYVSEHPRATCDEYYIFECYAGQPTDVKGLGRDQISRFISTNGVSVLDPS